MTKEEIIEVIHKTIYQFFDVCGDNEETPLSDKDKLLLSVNKAICNNIKALPPVTPTQRWIPISEKMPEQSTGVLVWCPERKNIYCACYEEKQWWIFGSYWDRVTSEVVAWMPLPKPYREDKGNRYGN